ncbi:MAG: C40 family peptidase [Clostridia bacterium]
MKKFIAAFFTAIAIISTVAFAEGFASGYVTCDVLNIRSEPNAESQIVAKAYQGTKLNLLYCNGYNWYCVELANGTTGFCNTDYISFQPTESSIGQNIVNYAKTLLGKPYVYGASGPNAFDCSGFTSYVFAANGISLPRSSRDQSNVGTTVSRSDLRPGDLVFFATGSSGAVSHVGIYIGDGNIIHAATGQGKISINNLSQSYYSSRYKWAKRVF